MDENAPIVDCFKSVMKVYRIMQPTHINFTDQQLTDNELVLLLEYMKEF
jgi:hypothetical protein